ncbi:LacI family DNA-binding transcriptional regulator [Deminuibacter soli]|uniref:LacI family transcriptional regulator n=1 Tax=Deminuibacter soli TaxID=2291815 RepID=A0A3E1NCE5_9BACT|nr:LacI family DNA-binding transcriptional regulator [Deminuibacter soli]RFM25656.1 LacI family transcriptional regulator [Deminuibacter soli]
MPVTIKDLAQELRLSVATISKALKDSYEISAETKQRVLELAHRLHYVPNPYASSLRKGSSKTIAVVVPEVADSFFALSINGIESVAREKGYHVLIYQTHEQGEREQAILQAFHNGRVDGVLLSVSGDAAGTDHFEELCANDVPLVFFDRVCTTVAAARVQTDDQVSGYMATQHLLEAGCKRIAVLAADKQLSIISDRIAGFEAAIAESASPRGKHTVLYCDAAEENAYGQLVTLLQGSDRPDGIIGLVESLALLAYKACNALQLSIPRDVKVMGFSNTKAAALLQPSLTTITQPAFDMGRQAAILLFKALQKSHFSLKEEWHVLPSVLEKRASTGSGDA